VDPSREWVVPLAEAADWGEQLVGGKTAKLALLARAGFRVPDGFCLTTAAYDRFLQEARLTSALRMELGRKPLDTMRWEEIWDAALRIRSAFLRAPIPRELTEATEAALVALGPHKVLAVRSSAPGEDSAGRSFAGLHESVVGVAGLKPLLDAIRVVWASLWSDAALLYRRELSLEVLHSRMAVLVQEVIEEDRSGVAFGRDPRQISLDQAIVEAVPGPCRDLVDGAVDPDHWVLDRSSGTVLAWRSGHRDGEQENEPLLGADDLGKLWTALLRIEAFFCWPPDMEWTGQGERFVVLQARPITTAVAEPQDQRSWYLALRPGLHRLLALSKRVEQDLIPRLDRLGQQFAAEPIEGYSDQELATAINERYAAVQEWRQIYLEEFIPLAHGVRHFGTYYNDAVRPEDPYEFVLLLQGEPMVASQRNRALGQLAQYLAANPILYGALGQATARDLGRESDWREMLAELDGMAGLEEFIRQFEAIRTGAMDVAYEDERLSGRRDLLLHTVLQMARASRPPIATEGGDRLADADRSALRDRLLEAVGETRWEEALEALRIGKLSWRLRDDDNVLLGRLESQLLRAVQIAAQRLRSAGRLPEGSQVGLAASAALVDGLRDPSRQPVRLPDEPVREQARPERRPGESPRQLVGQPAAPGLAAGRVRRIRSVDDLGRFQVGEVLVCDAIQPMMTHLVPLAAAIVERRGGMLIHGAIIAREWASPASTASPRRRIAG
jgi:hypothetical protein